MKEILLKLKNGETLTTQETYEIMLGINEGRFTEIQIAAMLAMMEMRGTTVDELLGFRKGLLETRIAVDLSEFSLIDIVGTGGDGKNTFNISTCACFVVAGAGYHVAKHGNFGATSVSGASNVIQEHGVIFTNNREKLARSIEKSGVAYLHAQLFHHAMKNIAPVRKALQVPTVFNLLGPLINPATPEYQLLGVANLEQMRFYTNTLRKTGTNFTVVTSIDGYDEISLTDEFKVMTNKYETIYSPSDLGFCETSQDDMSGGKNVHEAKEVFDSVLENRSTVTQRNTVVANAAFAIQTINPDKSISDCIGEARESIDSGKALASLRKFIEINS